MIHYIGTNYITFMKKPEIEGFKRVQVFTLGTKSVRKRICTLLYDGLSITSHNINFRSFFDERDKQMNAVIRSNMRNTFDNTAILFAIPYNGQLYPPKMDGYRYRNVFSVDVTPAMVEKHKELASYNKILYGLVEVYSNCLDPNHKQHKDRIFINIITKSGKKVMNNCIVVSQQTKEIDGKTVKTNRIWLHDVYDWKVPFVIPNREIPWDVYGDPRVKTEKKKKSVKPKKSFKSTKPNNNRKITKFSKERNKSNNIPYSSYRSNNDKNNSYSLKRSKNPYSNNQSNTNFESLMNKFKKRSKQK